jgi:DNA-binding LacI/PurR family transcriptional regulator
MREVPVMVGRLPAEVYQVLRRELRQGFIPAGGRLPTEAELGARFGAGRNTIRRALALLAEEGLIETRRGSGSIVRTRLDDTHQSIVAVMYSGDLGLLTQVQDAALERGHTLSLFSQQRRYWDVAAEAAFLRQVRAQRHRGLLAFCSPIAPRNDALLAELVADGTRVIHTAPCAETLPVEEYLLPDYERAGYLAATSLLLAGYPRVLCATMPDDGPFALLIERGVRAAITDFTGRPASLQSLAEEPLAGTRFDMPRVGREADGPARLLRLAEPDLGRCGVVVSTLDRAEVMVGVLRQAGVYDPTRLGLIGIETTEAAGRATELPAIRFPFAELYHRALVAITEPEVPPLRVLLAPRLEGHALLNPALAGVSP